MFSLCITGAGMRAKEENSSTMRPISPTWRTIVSVQTCEGLRVVDDLLQIFALQPLGGELDRRQRILDLMGDAPGDIGPGRLALGAQQLGHVVEGDDEAVALAPRRARRRRAPAGCACCPPRSMLICASAGRSGAAMASSSSRAISGTISASRSPTCAVEIDAEQLAGRAVGQLDPARPDRGR